MTQAKPANWRVLFDLNVLLDVLMQREPHFGNAARLWALAETGQIEGVVAGHSFTTLFYLYRQQYDLPRAYQAILSLLKVFNVASVDRQALEMACDQRWPDFEYAVQAMAAINSGCEYLLTRDPKGYPTQSITVIQPPDLLAVWAAGEVPQQSED